jgi:hypothetical protein
MRAGYSWNIYRSTANEIAQIPLLQTHSIHAYDRLLEISSISSSVRSDIPRFLKQLYAHRKLRGDLNGRSVR